jgi:hypothetical protein
LILIFTRLLLSNINKDGGLTYFADIIELKTGASAKISLGLLLSEIHLLI